MKIRLDLAEILRISKLDWRDGGGKNGRKGVKGRSEGILLCNGLMLMFRFFWLLAFHFLKSVLKTEWTKKGGLLLSIFITLLYFGLWGSNF